MAKDFISEIDSSSYPIPSQVAIMNGTDPIDVRFTCDTVADFQTAANEGLELRYDGLVTYEKTTQKLKLCKYDGASYVWLDVIGSGGGSGITLRDPATNESFTISTSTAPTFTTQPSNVAGTVNTDITISYAATDDVGITTHEFSEDDGVTWVTITPTTSGSTYSFTRTYTSAATKTCKIRVGNSNGLQTVSNSFTITIVTSIVSVESVSVSPPTASFTAANETKQLTATIIPSNATNQSVSWTSSADYVATVSSTGLVTAVSNGTATITCTTADGGKTATCGVTVVIPISVPTFTTQPSNVSGEINSAVTISYGATDDLEITTHEFSEDDGATWSNVTPTASGSIYSFTKTYTTAGTKTCKVRVGNEEGEKTVSDSFTITIASSIDTNNPVFELLAKNATSTTEIADSSVRELPITHNFNGTTSGIIGGDIIFDSDTTFSVSNTDEFDFSTSDFSIQVIMDIVKVLGNGYVFVFGSDITANFSLSLFISSGGYGFKTRYGTGTNRVEIFSDTPENATGNYLSYTFVRSGTSLKIYVDDTLYDEKTIASTLPFSNGLQLSNLSYPFAGKLKGMYVYKRVITTEEMTTNKTNALATT